MSALTPTPSFIVADDHPMVRDALALALRAAFPKSEVALAGTLDEASAAIAARPDVDLVILDLDMPGMQGLVGVSALRASYPSAPLVIVSATRNAAAMRQVVEMGAAGFIPKSAPMEEIIASVRAVMRGEIVLPPSAGDALSSTDADLATRAARMTPQQHRVFALMAEGKPNKIIAYDMQIGEATVKAHVTEILRKMGVHSRTQAIVLAQRLALDPGAPPPAPIADEA
ncbi:MAG: DNA-binding response regulator [Rhodospirillum sp.]|nr:DNA-binding response regulator [Rhodospirillum sp.]